jgi:hypothetical protein
LSIDEYIQICNYNTLYPEIFMRGYSDNSELSYNRSGSLCSNIIENDDKISDNKIFNYICDNHSIGGYSGSPVFLKISNSSFVINEKCVFLGINYGNKREINNVIQLHKLVENLVIQIPTRYVVSDNTRQSFVITSKKIIDIENIILS